MCRTIAETMKSLEVHIRDHLRPAILRGRTISDEMRRVLNLPARMGRMGFLNPSLKAEKEYQTSILATSQLTDAIYNQDREFVINEEEQSRILKALQKSKESWVEGSQRASTEHDERSHETCSLVGI